MLESSIQTSIRNILKKSGWIVIKLIQTSVNGIPDLMCLKNGKTIFVEVKQPGEKPSPLQLIRHSQLINEGFEVIVATGKEHINHLLHNEFITGSKVLSKK